MRQGLSAKQAIQRAGLALAVFCGSAGLGLAQGVDPNVIVRAFVEARCSAQLVDYEAGRKVGTSIFGPDRASWDGTLPPTSANLADGTWGSLIFSAAYDLAAAQLKQLPQARLEVASGLSATLALADCLFPSAAEREAVLSPKGATERGFSPNLVCLTDRLRQAVSALRSDLDDAALDARLDFLMEADTAENLECVEGQG